ncbi:hypothetical protein GXP67_08310 [Rhodocytophaga rosea]|uniref:Uncharacterized protein n=1 Tax=Rhodocytophaga rosea TaxID=2704465 RepID=A0A6C0GG53_9BACT|nr:hypothetical protein [Rhodocytophaga rosea]QHT66660.1 hypothetical protein GXP67_08310 [Rhodocytophaga rosea]
MKKEDLQARFETLEKKTLQLIDICDTLKAELKQATQENEELKLTVKKQAAEMKTLAKKQESNQNNFQFNHKMIKLVDSITADSNETTDIKARIDEYIQELNKCIAHLSQHI